MKFMPHALNANGTNSREKWFGAGGQLNASSNLDAAKQIGKLLIAVANKEVTLDDDLDEDNQETASAVRANKRQMIAEAYHDHSTGKWMEVGTSIGSIIYETAKRAGFMRRFLQKGDLADGSYPRVQVRVQNVSAVVATGPSMVATQFARQKYLYPPEFYISGNVRVEDRDIAQGAPDLLEDTMNRALEQINVVEDRVYIKMLDQTVGVSNPMFLLSGGLNPSNLAAARTSIINWGLSAEKLLIASDYWTDIIGNATAFNNLFDPVTQYEIIKTGSLGTLLGMEIVTDGFRDPSQRVVATDDMYIISSPQNHGSYTDRGPVKVVPVDNYNDGVPARGWFFTELMSAVVGNSRSVTKCRRV